MKKVLILFYSQNGSTKTITDEIIKGLKKQKCEIDSINILNDKIPNIDSYDIIGIGFPVYFFRPPHNFIKLIKKISSLKDKYYFVYKTYGSNPGAAANSVRKILNKKEGKEIGYRSFLGEDHAYIYIKNNKLLCAGQPDEEQLKKARNFGEEIIKNIYKNNYKKPKKDKLKGLIYKLSYLSTSKFLIRYIYSHFFKVDKNLCNSCNICVEECPCNNIKLNKEGYPKWGRDCIFCWYCELKCPKNAIKSPADWKVFEPLIKHSLSVADINPEINIEEIDYIGGKIIKK